MSFYGLFINNKCYYEKKLRNTDMNGSHYVFEHIKRENKYNLGTPKDSWSSRQGAPRWGHSICQCPLKEKFSVPLELLDRA